MVKNRWKKSERKDGMGANLYRGVYIRWAWAIRRGSDENKTASVEGKKKTWGGEREEDGVWKGSGEHERLATEGWWKRERNKASSQRELPRVASFLESPSFLLPSARVKKGKGEWEQCGNIYSEKRIRRLLVRRSRKRRKTPARTRVERIRNYGAGVYRAQLRRRGEGREWVTFCRSILLVTMNNDSERDRRGGEKERPGGSARE